MKPGFTLIEVLVATLIASILGGILFMSYYQTNRATVSMGNAIDVHEKMVLLAGQLERDISGAFIPQQESDEKKQQAPTEAPPAADAKKPKPITHIFYSVNKDKNLDLLTCITNNSLQVYWSARAGGARPRAARVVYRLVPEKPRRGLKQPSFVLMRQEAQQLDFDAYKTDAAQPIKSFEMVDGIKDLSISFGTYIEKKSPEQQDQEGAQEASKPEFKTFDDWNLEGKQEESQEQRRKVPHEVTITASLWNAQQTSATPMSYKFVIIPDLALPDKQEQESPQPQQAQKKEAAAAAQQQAAPAQGQQKVASAQGPGKVPLNTWQRLLGSATDMLNDLQQSTGVV